MYTCRSVPPPPFPFPIPLPLPPAVFRRTSEVWIPAYLAEVVSAHVYICNVPRILLVKGGVQVSKPQWFVRFSCAPPPPLSPCLAIPAPYTHTVQAVIADLASRRPNLETFGWKLNKLSCCTLPVLFMGNRDHTCSYLHADLASCASLVVFRHRLSHPWFMLIKRCFTSIETVGLLGTGTQDVHLEFHTAPEPLCPWTRLAF